MMTGLYSEKEKIELDERLDDLSNRFKMDIVIHTSLILKDLRLFNIWISFGKILDTDLKAVG